MSHEKTKATDPHPGDCISVFFCGTNATRTVIDCDGAYVTYKHSSHEMPCKCHVETWKKWCDESKTTVTNQ
jgi:hypothetical protein